MNQSNERELFELALALAPALRGAFLAKTCSDAKVRAQVERLLAVDGVEPRLLANPFEVLYEGIGEQDADPVPPPGSLVGPFRLIETLGEGGSSIVFRAKREQDGVTQEVALKVLRRNLYSPSERRHFRDERQALATLQHPGIARLIEGGITDSGVAYIALELVEGRNLLEHAQVHLLDVRARLELFVDACRAVDAAHRALIVHRDLKPSNILVTTAGHVKLLDFGIAKLLDLDADNEGMPTQTVQLTPAYAAPEQFARGRVTTATDVYALGVVLGELLTGQTRKAQDSPTPSARIDNRSRDDAQALVARRLRRQLRGDLDNIVLHATDVEPERRYLSAAALADDIDRYLSGQTVTAHPPSRLYSARKFLIRHRGTVVATALFLIMVFSSLGVALWQLGVAHAQAQRAASVRDFLLRVFSAAEPAGPRAAPPSVAEVVRVSIAEAQRSTNLYPDVRVELVSALGDVLRKQGEYKESVGILEANYKDAVVRLGETSPVTIGAGLALATAFADAHENTQARAWFDRLVTLGGQVGTDLYARILSGSALLASDADERSRAFADSDAAMAACAEGGCGELTRIDVLRARARVLASFQQDEDAIPMMEQALLLQRAFYGGAHVLIAENEQELSRAHRRLGHLEQAESYARDALEIVEASVSDPHFRRVEALDTLRQVLIDTRRFDEAEGLGLRIIAMEKATLGADHAGLATSENSLGFTYMQDNKFSEAIEHYRAALAISERIPGNDRRSAIYRANLGVSLGRNGDLAEGMKLVRTSIGVLRNLPEPDYDQLCSALEKLGSLQRSSGDAKSAADAYREALEIYAQELPQAPKAWRVVSYNGLGRSLLDVGDHLHAAEAFREALANVSTPADRIAPDRIEANAGLAASLQSQGDLAGARQAILRAKTEGAATKGHLSAPLQVFVDTTAAMIPMP